jgi:hypothetical protein
MANMLPSETDRWVLGVWRRLALPGSTLAQDLSEAYWAACDPSMSLSDCPWNHHGHNRYFRARRVAWRVAFRLTRELREVPFITIERRAA